MTAPHPLRCETCENSENTNCPLSKYFSGELNKFVPPSWRVFAIVGCASHSDFHTRGMTEEQRKYILSFKEEDPLLMAFSEGQNYERKKMREIIGEIHGLTFLLATQTGNEDAIKACNLSADLLRQEDGGDDR